ncbi:DUF4925 domain-containing protein [Parabacteroides sp. TM07-1AC]|uniref:DUF4925 domain-containing protein n=1 Tax=Parabacteroides sp. TM07-1AC TaxID=2292363 RepID=UPI000EFF1543|nr:DUF4925 domain-containing protein [Parabacteroides sp. TM07-1AC]RHU26166.1 DUF4925 domain-containing protein [Parabacteroides sp. TM07-1AC]
MNKYLLRNFLYAICMATLLFACDDNDDQDGSGISGIYSNKLSTPEGDNTLTLTYSGREFIGKDVTFKQVNGNTANITLHGILPGETATVLENIPISADGNGYSFSGSSTGNNGTAFSYQGKVETGKMTLALTDVKVASNQLTSNAKWHPVQTAVTTETDPIKGEYTCYHYAFHLVTDNLILGQAAPQLEAILGNLITWFINEVTFNPDGNITARYATMPEGKAIGDLINIPPDRKDSEWLSSPINLASYYVKDDSELYIIPNIDMILYQIEQNKTKADGGLDAAVIAAVYQQLNKWSTTGIRMNIRKNSEAPYNNMGKLIAYKGDIFLFLDKEEVAAFLPLLSLVKDLLPEDILNGPMGSMIGPLLDMLANSLQQAKTLEMGMMLTK